MQELLALLQDAGHADFREARGPMGFTQRQAAGKFTRDEVAAFVEQLQEAAEGVGGEGDDAEPAAPPVRLTAADRAIRALPDAQLAAELQRRGWIVVEP